MLDRMPRAAAMYAEAQGVMPGGVTSSWASTRPIPLWVDRGHGGHVWDVDGNEYVDLHGGYGVNVVGHAHPADRRGGAAPGHAWARTSPSPRPTRSWWPNCSAERFGLPHVALHQLGHRGDDGRHPPDAGDHRSRPDHQGRGLVPRPPRPGERVAVAGSGDLGPVDDPIREPGPGIPQAIADLVRIVPFNDLAAVERVFAAHPGQIAGMILEPMMMNAGIIPPAPGYLARPARSCCHATARCSTFDEVKTGLVVAPGGATELFGVRPDIVCLAKALGGGVPCGAVGGTAEVMERDHRRPLRPGRHVQRQPAHHGGGPSRARRGAHASSRTSTPSVLGRTMFDESMAVARRARHPRLRLRVRLQGIGRVPRPSGHQLSRVPRDRHRRQPPALPRAAQRRRVHGAVGQDRVVDAVDHAHRRRRRSLRRQHATARRAGRRASPTAAPSCSRWAA